jgi:diaminohydroxyphosphoribosylaminopyrimidine deaminase/5-amino-6-(5-phosphoribosylamino)uracil reductase
MTDREGVAQALALAAFGEGTTRPNPLVGCLVVKDGAVVASGYHRAAGEPHAEAVALEAAGEAARGATLFVNLEPCAHHGRTPPCTEAIAKAGIGRVVAAMRDPNPLVDGRGIEALRTAGIAVTVGVLEEEARSLNAPFVSIHERRRPWVTLKAAASLDGRIAASRGSSTWVTGEASRRHVHRLRLAHDAVLVGGATVRRDDPRLTVRLPGVAAPRLRVVLSRSLDLDPRSLVFVRQGDAAPRTRVYTMAGGVEPAGSPLREVAEVVVVSGDSAGLDLAAVLGDLAGSGVQAVLVEGGGATLGAFLAAGLADEVALFLAPAFFGANGATPLLDLPAVAQPQNAWRLDVRRRVPIGEDLLVVGRPARA